MEPSRDTNGKDMGIGLGGLFGSLIGLGIAAAAVDIMRSTLDKEKHRTQQERNRINPYSQYRGMHGVKPTLQKTVPGVYKEFPGAGKTYSNTMQGKIDRMIRR